MATAGNLTPQQDRAIHARGVSVALSAGAGCGKTFVLTERFLAELEPPEPGAARRELSELIAITFTERAAREMRERLRAKTLDRLRGAEADHWLKLLRELDAARVSTIHAFCGNLLRAHAVEAQLDPRFQVFEESEAATLLSEVTDDVLRKWLVELREEVMALASRFGLNRLREMLYAIRHQGQPQDRELWQARTADEQLDRWAEFHRETFLPQLLQGLVESPPARELLRLLTEIAPQTSKIAAARSTLVGLLPNLPKSKNLSLDLDAIREAAKVQGITTKKEWPSEAAYEAYKNAAEGVRKQIDGCRDRLQFDREAARPSAVAGLQLWYLAADVRKQFAARKQELGYLDFDDLIGHAVRLLVDPSHAALRERLASKLALLLVDEFQDTDPLQVEIVKALCGSDWTAGKLFFVGDRKQSIYRFRGAAPHVFRDLRDQIPAAGRLPLTLNFRSQPQILEFVNALFVDRFGPDYERLDASRPQTTPLPAVEFLWTVPDFSLRAAGGMELARRHEADFLARRLKQIFTEGEPLIPIEEPNLAEHARGAAPSDKSSGSKSSGSKSSGSGPAPALRPARYGDVALLFRALSDVQHYEQALQEHEIPYYLVGGHAFYAQQEIFDVLNLLRAMESEADEVSLAGVLRSPFFSLDDATLFWLAQQKGGLARGFYATRLPAELSVEQCERANFARRTLTALRIAKDRLPIAQLLQQAFARTGYDAAILAEFLGERKLANLRKLIEQARGFDEEGIFTLADFIVQLSEFVAKQPREPLAATHPESSNVVRLMTIHQAKGLEFPIVAITDLNRPKRAGGESAVFTAELGPLLKVAPEDEAANPCVGLDMYRLLERAEDDAETDRLLYVAATRAADMLLLSSSVADLERPSGPWTRLLGERFDLATGQLKVTLPPGYLTPQVKVLAQTVSEQRPSTPRRAAVDWETAAGRAEQIVDRNEGALALATAAVSPNWAARRHYSFSRLSGILEALEPAEEDAAPPWAAPRARPDDATGAGSHALALGSLVHAVLASYPFDGENLAPLVARHGALLRAEDEATFAEAEQMLARFGDSPLAAKLAASAERHSELEFLLAWPPETPDPFGPYIQGFIDALYRDAAGAWHLVDFKTNRVEDRNLEQVAAHYELQMRVYALAVEQVLGVTPASLTLYFLRAGLERPVAWDDRIRRETIERVNSALAAVSSTG
ncbi:MAG TPA: UvrD-helicase domain-containing protein [Pirellulales bacterium]|nr:UvrD-helicase domain-containing protein [Pirellulales bacterium]